MQSGIREKKILGQLANSPCVEVRNEVGLIEVEVDDASVPFVKLQWRGQCRLVLTRRFAVKVCLPPSTRNLVMPKA